MNAYSLDFRKAVLMYVDECHSQKDAAALFKITPKCVSKLAEIESSREITGSSSAKKSIQIVFMALKEYIDEHPDSTLAEVANHFNTQI